MNEIPLSLIIFSYRLWFHVWIKSEFDISLSLGTTATVFQSEIIAISEGTSRLLEVNTSNNLHGR